VSYPLPGTKFHELVKEQLQGKTHWQESDDLDMMFQGTYTSEFYRAVRNLLHDQVSLERLNVAAHEAEYDSARRILERRWHELLTHESQYRTAVTAAPAIAAAN
jgi:anaerobic magnesium-protoporphyrin IX monomethyl ester cyclase